MPRTFCLSILLCAAFAAAQDAPKPLLTARELFYSAASDAPPAAKPAPKAAPPKNAMSPKKAPVAPAQTAASAPPQPAAPQTPAPQPAAPQHTQPVALPDGATLVKASTPVATAPAPSTGTPLGLKYTILKKSGDDMVEVPRDTVFHAGDKIQLSVQTNGPGYLYIISQGSSGTWKPMFPSPEVADGNNHVDGWNAVTYPPKTRMVFDEQTGMEKIFIVFSRTPEAGLENMIYSLQSGGKAKPAATRPEQNAPKQMVQIAMANIDDATVGQLRDTYTRDLIIETVDEKTPGEKKENAVYVVNPSGSSDSRVVADLKLVHQ
jgi:hypothetical protein